MKEYKVVYTVSRNFKSKKAVLDYSNFLKSIYDAFPDYYLDNMLLFDYKGEIIDEYKRL